MEQCPNPVEPLPAQQQAPVAQQLADVNHQESQSQANFQLPEGQGGEVAMVETGNGIFYLIPAHQSSNSLGEPEPIPITRPHTTPTLLLPNQQPASKVPSMVNQTGSHTHTSRAPPTDPTTTTAPTVILNQALPPVTPVIPLPTSTVSSVANQPEPITDTPTTPGPQTDMTFPIIQPPTCVLVLGDIQRGAHDNALSCATTGRIGANRLPSVEAA